MSISFTLHTFPAIFKWHFDGTCDSHKANKCFSHSVQLGLINLHKQKISSICVKTILRNYLAPGELLLQCGLKISPSDYFNHAINHFFVILFQSKRKIMLSHKTQNTIYTSIKLCSSHMFQGYLILKETCHLFS